MQFQNTFERRLGPVLEARPAVLLLFLLAAILIVVFYDFITFQKLYLFKDIGSDTINGRYPRLVLISDYLREHGLPKWSFSQGMGQNILPFALGNPFDIALYAIGSDNLVYGIAYIELLKIFLAGTFFFLYLRILGLSPYACVVGGLLYAMSGFMIVGGGWYKFSTEGVYFALMLYSFERVLIHRSWWLFPLVVALIGADVPFNVYLFGIFLFIYSAFRYLDAGAGRARDYFVFIAKLAALGALGIGISAFFVVSALLEMLQSPRVAGDATFMDRLSQVPTFALAVQEHYITALMRLFSSDMLGTGSQFSGWQNYLEAPMFYCGLVTLLLAPQVFVKASSKMKLLYAALVTVFVIPVILPFFRFAIWLFSGDYYRTYSVFIAVVLLFMALRALSAMDRHSTFSVPLLLGTAAFLLGTLVFPFYADAGRIDMTLMGIVLALIVIYCALIYALARAPRKTMVKVVLLAVLCMELGYLASVNVNERPALAVAEFNDKIGYNDYTVDAISYIEDKERGFYRVEKNYTSGLAMHSSMNDSKVQGYRGTMSYHSFNQLNYIKFLDAVGVIDSSIESQTRWAPGLRRRPVLMTLASVKYYLTKGDVSPFMERTYDKIAQFGDVAVLKNRYYLPLGFTYNRYITESRFGRLTPLQKDIALLNAVVVEDDMEGQLSEYEALDLKELTRAYNLRSYRSDVMALQRETLHIETYSPNHIKGSIDLRGHRVLFFSIPYDRGWSAYIDGAEVALRRVNVGFSGLSLAPGHHEVRLEYQPRCLNASAVFSGAALLLYGFLLWFSGQRRSDKMIDLGASSG